MELIIYLLVALIILSCVINIFIVLPLLVIFMFQQTKKFKTKRKKKNGKN